MIMKRYLLIFAVLFSIFPAFAWVDSDTIAHLRTLEEVVVSAPERETNVHFFRPSSVTRLTPEVVQALQIDNITKLSATVPNLHIPNYGSKMSSAIYVRGIGTRSSGHTVGVYLDGVPVMNKNSFQFEFPAVQSIEVLRGPQGTLYGRNALGGIINVHTASPFQSSMARAALAWGSYQNIKMQAAIPCKLSETLAVGVAVMGERSNGYWKNSLTGLPIDSLLDLSGMLKTEWRPTDEARFTLLLHMGYLHQGAFPYRHYDSEAQILSPVALDAPSNYRRAFWSARLLGELRKDNYKVHLALGYEGLKDRMCMDQDYSAESIFTLQQRLFSGSLTGELLLKGHDTRERHHYSVGLFGFFQRDKMNAPVTFETEGLKRIVAPVFEKLNSVRYFPEQIFLNTSQAQLVDSRFLKPSFGVATYAQYTLNDLFVRDLSLTAGIRAGVELHSMDYYSAAAFAYSRLPHDALEGIEPIPFVVPTEIQGNAKRVFGKITPRLSLNYQVLPELNTYFSFTTGYKSGGFNEQVFADLVQQQQREDVTQVARGQKIEPMSNVDEKIYYRPEESLNYELGGQWLLWERRLQLEASLFYTSVNNQQVTDFVGSGLGRMLSNVGHSTYWGAELSAQCAPLEGLSFSVGYGFSYATLRGYVRNKVQPDGSLREEKSNPFIPYVPRHTLACLGRYTRSVDSRRFFIDSWSVQADVNAIGPIYWTLRNDLSEKFNALVGAKVAIRRGDFSLSCTAHNISSIERTAFYFESLGRTLLQLVPPIRLEVGLQWHPRKF